MAHWPLPTAPRTALSVPRGSSTISTTTITASAVANTKGTWTELVASTSGKVTYFVMYIAATQAPGAASSVLLDLGIGSLASEVTIIENMLAGCTYGTNIALARPVMLPLHIPAGTRIAARCQSDLALKTCLLALDLYGGESFEGPVPFQRVSSYGPNTATSKGVVLTAGGTNNTKGAWVELTSSSLVPHSMAFVLLQPNGRVITGTENWLIDIGIGGAGSEAIVEPDWPLRYESDESLRTYGVLLRLPLEIAPGTRVAIRGACNTANLTLDAALYGLS